MAAVLTMGIALAATPALADGPDTTPPETTITDAPGSFTNETTATLAFTGSDPAPSSGLGGFECSLDGGAWGPCEAGDSFDAPEGEHDFRVRAIDAAGNADPTPAERSWAVDTTDPVITIDAPAAKQRFLLHRGSKDYSCSDPASGGPQSVASGVASCDDDGFSTDIALGPKLLTVTARDRAGNESSETRAYVVEPRDYGEFVGSQRPIAYYRFNEALGSSDMRDRSGNGYDGTYQNGIALRMRPATACARRPDPPRACESAGEARDFAAHFPPRDGHGYVNGIAAPKTAYTIEAWVRPADGDDMMVFGHGGAGQLFISDGKLALRQVQDVVSGGGPTLAPGRWWHVAATWDGSYTRLYVNGEEVASSGDANKTPSGISTLFVGYGEMAPWFHGDIDEVAYYDRALSRHDFRDRVAIASAADHPSLGPGDLNTAGPRAEIAAPTDDALYAPTKVPRADFACTDPDGRGDVRSCAATVDGAPIASGDQLPSGPGPHRFVLSAADRHGNTYQRTHTYVVKDFSWIIGHDVPIAYYRLGDGAGATMVDASPSGHHGEYKNGQESGPVGISGDGDHARSFRGDGGYGYVNGIAAPRYAATLEAWVNPDDGRDQAILGHGDAGELYIRDGRFRFRHMDRTVSASIRPKVGEWQQVVGVWDGAEIRIYVDGVEAGSTEATKRPSSISTFYVGYGELAPWFKGSIDEVAYYDTALTPDRVFQHWLADPPPDDLRPVGSGPGDSDPPPVIDAKIRKVKLGRRALKVKLRCMGGAACSGTVEARLKLGGKRRKLRLPAKGFEAAAGGRARLRVRLSRAERPAVRRAKRVRAVVKLRAPSGRILDRARAR